MQILWNRKLIKFSNGSYVAFRLKRKRFIFANKNELELNCAILSYLESQIETLKKIYAELKAKTQWHNLRENPNDLPKENGEYACRIPYYDSEITFNGFLNYNSEQKVFWLDDIKSNFTVVAWCEIPTFTDKE